MQRFAIGRILAVSSGALTPLFLASRAHAQAASSDNTQSAKTVEGEEGIVVMRSREILPRSPEIKRNPSGISNTITAEGIGKFPDVNISGSLQRIRNFTLDRTSTGDGRAINLRELGPEFSRNAGLQID